jgi:hypothetical protein
MKAKAWPTVWFQGKLPVRFLLGLPGKGEILAGFNWGEKGLNLGHFFSGEKSFLGFFLFKYFC